MERCSDCHVLCQTSDGGSVMSCQTKSEDSIPTIPGKSNSPYRPPRLSDFMIFMMQPHWEASQIFPQTFDLAMILVLYLVLYLSLPEVLGIFDKLVLRVHWSRTLCCSAKKIPMWMGHGSLMATLAICSFLYSNPLKENSDISRANPDYYN